MKRDIYMARFPDSLNSENICRNCFQKCANLKNASNHLPNSSDFQTDVFTRRVNIVFLN